MNRSYVLILVVAWSVFGTVGLAGDINKRLGPDPGTQAMINRVIPQSRSTGASYGDMRPNINADACSQDLGNVTIESGGRIPLQVNTVIRGDVINVCR